MEAAIIIVLFCLIQPESMFNILTILIMLNFAQSEFYSIDFITN